MKRTPINNIDQKLDILEHLNQDHSEEVLALVCHYHRKENITAAQIADIFQEGLLIGAETDNGKKELWVAFELKGELE